MGKRGAGYRRSRRRFTRAAPLIAWLMAMPASDPRRASDLPARLPGLPVRYLQCPSATRAAIRHSGGCRRGRRSRVFGHRAGSAVDPAARLELDGRAGGARGNPRDHPDCRGATSSRGRRPTIAAVRDLRSFAATVWGGSLIGLVSGNADFLLVGRLLGASALGFYVLAWDLLRFVPDRLYKVAGRVTFPAFCLLQDNDTELGARLPQFLRSTSPSIVLPVAACAAVAAPELIGTIYGARWLPAAHAPADALRRPGPGRAENRNRLGLFTPRRVPPWISTCTARAWC